MVRYADTATGVVSIYAYDALGRRISKEVTENNQPSTVNFFYHSWQVCEEQDENNEIQATYVYGLYIDEVLSMQRDIDVDGNHEDYYYHTDDLYNVMAITDSSGTVIERYDYDDYGEPSSVSGTQVSDIQSPISNVYLFNGRRYDTETKFYHYRTRYLEPTTGKFTARDTIGVWEDPLELGNGYSYVGNSPLVHLDAMGRGVNGACVVKCVALLASLQLACHAALVGTISCAGSGLLLWICVSGGSSGVAWCHKTANDEYLKCLEPCFCP